MKLLNKATAILLTVLMIVTIGIVGVSAATNDAETSQTVNIPMIVVHFKPTSKNVPTVYYWNSLPQNIDSPKYPGETMEVDTQTGEGWYTYTFPEVTKINMMFIEGGKQSRELTRSNAGEYWYMNGIWYNQNPEELDPLTKDLREDTIYFVITTRFYDGDTGNNVHCWDDSKANNPDADPAWRGDFKGLIDKLDYIKALGFSAIWITPVVTNASGYDYHGYHAFDFSTVDARYESSGATYKDLIAAAHAKGMKIVQDVVFQHTGNFGEKTFAPIFEKKYTKITDLEDLESSMIPTKMLLDAYGLKSAEEYYAQKPQAQYDERLNLMKQTGVTENNNTQSPLNDMKTEAKVSKDPVFNANNYYHNGYWQSLNWDDWTCKYAQIAGDCVDLNTENPVVAEKLVELYGNYIGMGVDSFRVDTVRHISRLSLNTMFNKQLKAIGGESFYMFGEICCRYSQVWYRDHASESTPFYTWAEPDTTYTSKWKWTGDADSVNSNMNLTLEHWAKYDSTSGQPTSTNAFLNGNEYHTPDYSKNSGMGAIDFLMHWQFDSASSAFGSALAEDKYFNDSTWNVVYVDSHDYAPDRNQKERFTGGTQTWAENMCLMFTFRGIPCLYYGSEIEFQKGMVIDVGPNAPLSTTGRAYFGDNIEGEVSASDYGDYTASGTVATTLKKPLCQQLIKLNKIRRAVPALQKGQYSVTGVTGDMCFKRGYTDPDSGEKSFACVAVTNAGTFKNIPNGTYIDAVTGNTKTVSNGTLAVEAPGKGNCRVYVLSSGGYTGIDGKIGDTTTYLK